MNDSLPPDAFRDPSATDSTTPSNALDLFPREEADPIAGPPPSTSTVFPVDSAVRAPRITAASERPVVLPPRTRRGRRLALALVATVEWFKRDVLARTARVCRRASRETHRFTRDEVLPVARASLTRMVEFTRRGREALAPAVHRGVEAMAVSFRKLAREPEVRDQQTAALEPSRLALLSSTTLIIAFIAISMDVNLRRPDTTALATAASLPPDAAFSPSVEALDSRPIADDNPEPVSAIPAAAVVPATPSRPSVERPVRRANASPAIQQVLNQYRDSVSTLDPASVKDIWPGVDELAMNAHFNALYDHNLQFDACRISVSGRNATALCRGSMSSIFNGRSRRRITQAREWKFTLRDTRGRWLITSVVSSQPGNAATVDF